MRALLDCYYLKHSSVICEVELKGFPFSCLISFHNLFSDMRKLNKMRKCLLFLDNRALTAKLAEVDVKFGNYLASLYELEI